MRFAVVAAAAFSVFILLVGDTGQKRHNNFATDHL